MVSDIGCTFYEGLVLAPDRRSDRKYDKLTSVRSAETAKYQLRNITGSCQKMQQAINAKYHRPLTI